MPDPQCYSFTDVCEVCHALTKDATMLSGLAWLGVMLHMLRFTQNTGKAVTCDECAELIEEIASGNSYQEVFEAVEALKSRHKMHA